MNVEIQDGDRRLAEPLCVREWLLMGTELFSVVMGITELIVATTAQHRGFSKMLNYILEMEYAIYLGGIF